MPRTAANASRRRRSGGKLSDSDDQHHGEPEGRVARVKPEDRPPSKVDEQLSAHERRENRRQSEDEHQDREDAHGLDLVEQVADDRSRNDERRASAERLHQPEHDKRLDPLSERASKRREREREEAEAEGRLPADAIGERAVHRLAGCHADEVHREADLHGAGARAELARDRRKRGQVHVDRQRAHGGQGPQRHRQLEILGSGVIVRTASRSPYLRR